MNIIWLLICSLSILVLIFVNPQQILPSLFSASNKALRLSFELLTIYSVWLGILYIIENTKLNKYISKLLSPIINLFWGKKNLTKEAKDYLSLSLSATLLGIGGASVPLGIKAIEKMSDNKSDIITFPMIMTIIFASTGLQLVPTTIMGLMVSSGSTNPAFIILPTLLSGMTTLVVGVGLALLFEKISLARKDKR